MFTLEFSTNGSSNNNLKDLLVRSPSSPSSFEQGILEHYLGGSSTTNSISHEDLSNSDDSGEDDPNDDPIPSNSNQRIDPPSTGGSVDHENDVVDDQTTTTTVYNRNAPIQPNGQQNMGKIEIEKMESIPAVDRQSGTFSIIGGKYLLVGQANTSCSNTTSASSSSSPTLSKNTQRCFNIETKETFLCKIIPRNESSLNLFTAYHKIGDNSDTINPIHQIIMGPKYFYLIFPSNYGNVHAYLLAKKRLREDETGILFKQMVEAVQHCHSKGIVLRDLKLGKFVFTDSERTKIKLETLEDSVLLEDNEDDGLSDKHGCPNYVSPEKAEILRSNSKYPGKATDVWGLGVMLYTMLVGRYPFNDPDHGKLFTKIRRGNFAIPEALSQNVKCLIRCLLRKEPSLRLKCNEILGHPWFFNLNSKSSLAPIINRSFNYSNSNQTAQHYPSVPSALSPSLRRKFVFPDPETSPEEDQVVPEWNSSKRQKIQ